MTSSYTIGPQRIRAHIACIRTLMESPTLHHNAKVMRKKMTPEWEWAWSVGATAVGQAFG